MKIFYFFITVLKRLKSLNLSQCGQLTNKCFFYIKGLENAYIVSFGVVKTKCECVIVDFQKTNVVLWYLTSKRIMSVSVRVVVLESLTNVMCLLVYLSGAMFFRSCSTGSFLDEQDHS